jgi:hypothetical protein
MSLLMRCNSTTKIVGRTDIDVAVVQFEEVDVPHAATVSLRSFGASGDTLRPVGLRVACHPKPVRAMGGGEGVSQSPLKDQAFSTFLDQNPPFELRRKLAFRSNLFMKSIVAPPSTGPSISVGGGQQGWLAFALRRQRSHVWNFHLIARATSSHRVFHTCGHLV